MYKYNKIYIDKLGNICYKININNNRGVGIVIRFILIQLIYIITTLNYLDNNNFIYLIMLLLAPLQFIISAWILKLIK